VVSDVIAHVPPATKEDITHGSLVCELVTPAESQKKFSAILDAVQVRISYIRPLAPIFRFCILFAFMSALAATPGSRRHGTSDWNESTDISVESSAPSDDIDVIEWGSSLPSTKTDLNLPNHSRDLDRDYTGRSDRNLKVSENQTTRIPLRRRSNRWVSVVVGMTVLIGAAIGVLFYLNSKDIAFSKQTEASIESSNSQKISLAELNTHNDATTDCLVSFHDTVFDVTAFALTHPGGSDKILSHCGKNATRAFALQHPASQLKLLSKETIMGVLQSTKAGGASKTNATSTDNSKATSKPVEQKDGGSDGGSNSGTNSPTAAPTGGGTATVAPTTSASCISATDVAKHATRDDCWYILYDQVYDFTNYIDLHPGGARNVFQECGTDATSVYVNVRKHNQNLLIQVGAPELYLLSAVC
jgi:cytochrome b involved in lipid metabolism